MYRLIGSICVIAVLFYSTSSPAAAILGGYPQPPHLSKEKTTRFIVKFRDGVTPSKQEIIQAFDDAGMAVMVRPLFTVDRVGPEYLGMEKPSITGEDHLSAIESVRKWILPPVLANHCTNPDEVHNSGSCPSGYKKTGTCIKPGSSTNCTPINSGSGGGGSGGGGSKNTPTPSAPPASLAPGQPTPTPGLVIALGLGAFTTFRQVAGRTCIPNQAVPCGQSGALMCDGGVVPPICKISECLGQQCTTDAITVSPFVSPQLQNMYAVITEDLLTPADFKTIISQVPDFEDTWPDLTLHAQIQPDDPYYQQQWAWKQLSLDDLNIPIMNQNAAVKISVVDTGIDALHEDLPGRSVTNGRDYVLCETLGEGETCQKQKVCREVSHGYCSNAAIDDNGHGTHIAGIIAAATDNALGISAAAQTVQLIPIKVMNANGETFESWLYEGIIYAVHQGAKTINVSIGGCASLINADGSCPHTDRHASSGFRHVFDYAITHGVTVVVAAGNENDDAQWYTPANYNNTPGRAGDILVVSATGPDKHRASYANFGSLVDVSAPGGNIVADINGDGAISTEDCTPQQCILSLFPMHHGRRFTDPNYESHAGTSMAAPHVIAEIALLLTKNPNLSVEEVINVVKQQSQPLPADHPIGVFIDPVAALDKTQEASHVHFVDPQCDLCGWCNRSDNPKPVNWDSCHACLYDSSGNATNKSYTVLGCVEATSGNMVQTILRVVLGVSGGIAFLAFLFGGYAVMTAAGDTHRLQMGKETIVSALVGLFVILFSVFILRILGVTISHIPGFS